MNIIWVDRKNPKKSKNVDDDFLLLGEGSPEVSDQKSQRQS